MVKENSKNRTSKFRQLASAMASTHITSFWREKIDEQPIHGYVLDYSPNLILLHFRSDAIVLDGYTVVRVEDVTNIELKPKYRNFYEKALKLRGQKPFRPTSILISDMRTLLNSVNEEFPLVTLHREEISDGCLIGRVKRVTQKSVELRCILPGAKWQHEATKLPLSAITKVDFGALYEEALVLVGGIKTQRHSSSKKR